MQHISENLVSLRAKVAEAAEQAGRSPEEIRILAISKTFPAESVRLAAAAGQVQFGENRIQEARTKIPEVNLPDLEWHMVGHLQSNKVRLAVQLFEVIQSVDSERIARKIDQVCSEQDKIQSIFIQVNVGDEIQKAGVPVEKVAELVEIVDELPHVSLQGLMAIPPYDEDPEKSRPYFKALAQLSESLSQKRSKPLRELSMGMSGDFEIAIQEGATIIRVGTAIFGERS